MNAPITRRRQHRVNTPLVCELWIGRTPKLIHIQNISTAGVFLKTSPSVTGNGYVTIRLFLPGEKPITVMGRVVQRQTGISNFQTAGVVVSFIDLHGQCRDRLERHVNRELNSFLIAYSKPSSTVEAKTHPAPVQSTPTV